MPKNNKIVYVVTQGEMGGAQRYVFELAQYMKELGYEVVVLVGAEKLELKKNLDMVGIETKPLKHLVRGINPLEDVLAIFELQKVFRQLRPALVHLNSGKAGFLGSLAAGLAGIRAVIFTAHGFSFLEPKTWPVKLFLLLAEKLARPFRKKIITVSDADRKAAIFHKLGGVENIITIHNGLNFEKFKLLPKNQARQLLHIDPSDKAKLVGTIANLYKTKGLQYLFLAAKKITAQFPLTKFIVLGEGPQRVFLQKKLISLGLEKKVFLLGYLAEASSCLSAFDIFVLPSEKEGLPYTILEAMAAGKPIVATTVGGIPEILFDKQSALLVPPRDPQALTEAIQILLTNPELGNRLGKTAQRDVQRLSLENTVNKTVSIYQSLLEG